MGHRKAHQTFEKAFFNSDMTSKFLFGKQKKGTKSNLVAK